MLHPIIVSIIAVSLVVAGCARQNDSNRKTSESNSPATLPAKPKSPQDTATPPSAQDLKSGNTQETVADPALQISDVVRCMHQDKRGILWFGTQDGLCSYDGKSLTYHDIRDEFGKGVTIKGIVEDQEGNLWIGFDGGIAKYDGESFTNFGEKDGLISGDVWSLAAGRDGTIWIGTIKGVCRFDGEVFTPFALPAAQPDYTRGITSGQIVHCIMVDRKEQVWFGTNGGAYIYDGRKLTNISEKDGLCNDAVHAILEDKSGNIWFGTTHKGVCRFDGKVFANFTEDGIVDGKEVWCLHEDKAGNVWFSGKRFGAYCYDGNSFTKFDEKDGLTSPGIMCIFEDKEKRLWLGGVQGLFRYDGQSIFNVKKNGPWQ